METNLSKSEQCLENQPSLLKFIHDWDAYYHNQVANIPLFDIDKTSKWINEQKTHFVKVFYHIRGHFHELMWFIANHAPDKKSKEIILENIAEEIGGNGLSHEKLYGLFAEAVGVDINKEYIEHETYLPFCKDFNQGHLRWLNTYDWEGKVSAFAALERLDNVDYVKGKSLAESLGLTGKQLTFFNVHIHVDHFGNVVRGSLGDFWQESSAKIEEAFYFIADHQSNMWRNLSDEIFNYNIK